MSFWQQLKAGLAYGLGGGFGWTLGSALARWLLRLAKFALAAMTVGGVAFCQHVNKEADRLDKTQQHAASTKRSSR